MSFGIDLIINNINLLIDCLTIFSIFPERNKNYFKDVDMM
jgi:hypothetical protein